MRRISSVLNLTGYALVWLVVIFVPILAFVGLLTEELVSTLSGGEGSTPAVSVAADCVMIVTLLLALVVWIYVLWRRVPLDWMKWPVVVFLAASLFSPILSVVFAICLGKFLIGAVGRGSVFARSQISPRGMLVAPRGLVGNDCYD